MLGYGFLILNHCKLLRMEKRSSFHFLPLRKSSNTLGKFTQFGHLLTKRSWLWSQLPPIFYHENLLFNWMFKMPEKPWTRGKSQGWSILYSILVRRRQIILNRQVLSFPLQSYTQGQKTFILIELWFKPGPLAPLATALTTSPWLLGHFEQSRTSSSHDKKLVGAGIKAKTFLLIGDQTG